MRRPRSSAPARSLGLLRQRSRSRSGPAGCPKRAQVTAMWRSRPQLRSSTCAWRGAWPGPASKQSGT
eukprot:11314077-Alexandrium_andersonii.AAC.1